MIAYIRGFLNMHRARPDMYDDRLLLIFFERIC
jgi:hypothetical protein